MSVHINMRILIVDDDQSILKGLSIVIRKFDLPHSCKIFTCDNAIDALEFLASGGADLLITDLEMPVMGGLALIKEVRERGYCEHFIILTGYANFEFARQALRYEVKDYLLKPVDKQELYKLINKLSLQLHGGKNTGQPELPPLDVFLIGSGREGCSEKMRKILEYIDNHYTTDLSLNLISEIFCITPSYICILFQQELHTTFLYYLDCVRLKKSALLLLSDHDRVIKDIAAASGFMNERHFYKVFKKRLNVTPGEFRESYDATTKKDRA